MASTEAEKPQGTGGQPGGSEAAWWSPGTHITTKRACKGPVPPEGKEGLGEAQSGVGKTGCAWTRI